MSKIKFQIKSRWNDSVLFEYEKENNTLKETVEKAIEENTNLHGANLEGANLKGANLKGAYLKGAYLYCWDNEEPNINEIIENLEENSTIKVKNYYINKHVLSPYYLIYWKNGLIIDEYEIIENKKEVKEMTIAEISEALGYDVKIVKEDK